MSQPSDGGNPTWALKAHSDEDQKGQYRSWKDADDKFSALLPKQLRALEDRLEQLEANLLVVDTILPRLEKLEQGCVPSEKVQCKTQSQQHDQRNAAEVHDACDEWPGLSKAQTKHRLWQARFDPELHRRHSLRSKRLTWAFYVLLLAGISVYVVVRYVMYERAHQDDNLVLKKTFKPLKLNVDKFPGVLLCFASPQPNQRTLLLRLWPTQNGAQSLRTWEGFLADQGGTCSSQNNMSYSKCYHCHIIFPIEIRDKDERIHFAANVVGGTSFTSFSSNLNQASLDDATKPEVNQIYMGFFHDSILGNWDPNNKTGGDVPSGIQDLFVRGILHYVGLCKLSKYTVFPIQTVRKGERRYHFRTESRVQDWFVPSVRQALVSVSPIIVNLYDVIGNIRTTLQAVSNSLRLTSSGTLASLVGNLGGRRLGASSRRLSCMCPQNYPYCWSGDDTCYRSGTSFSFTHRYCFQTCTSSFTATVIIQNTSSTLNTHSSTSVMRTALITSPTRRIRSPISPIETTNASSTTASKELSSSSTTSAKTATSSTSLTMTNHVETTLASRRRQTACMCPQSYPYCWSVDGTCYMSQTSFIFTHIHCYRICTSIFRATTQTTTNGTSIAANQSEATKSNETATAAGNSSYTMTQRRRRSSAGRRRNSPSNNFQAYIDFMEFAAKHAIVEIRMDPAMTQEVNEYEPELTIFEEVSTAAGLFGEFRDLVLLFFAIVATSFAPAARDTQFIRKLTNSLPYIVPGQTHLCRAFALSSGSNQGKDRLPSHRLVSRRSLVDGSEVPICTDRIVDARQRSSNGALREDHIDDACQGSQDGGLREDVMNDPLAPDEWSLQEPMTADTLRVCARTDALLPDNAVHGPATFSEVISISRLFGGKERLPFDEIGQLHSSTMMYEPSTGQTTRPQLVAAPCKFSL